MKKDYSIKVPNRNGPGEFLWKQCIVMRWDANELFREEMKKLR
jgi:hypothetical protein